MLTISIRLIFRMVILLAPVTKISIFSLIACFVINSLPCYANSVPTTINTHQEDKIYYEPKKSAEKSLEELYRYAIMVMLFPYIQKEVDKYYENKCETCKRDERFFTSRKGNKRLRSKFYN